MNSQEKAAELFSKGHNCCQAIVMAFGPDLGLDSGLASKIAAGFGGGIGATGEVCGAVSGAIIILGLRYGSVKGSEWWSKEKVRTVVREFLKRFREQHGEIRCNALLGHDISSPEGMKQIQRENLFRTQCPGFVKTAANILSQLL
jgi:C_GCAxxG_C_C family probable redox protein